MPKYLFQASYTAGGTKGLLKEGGTSRRATIEQTVKGLGGTLESFHFAFGDVDVFAIADLPDEVAATAVALVINSAGAATVKTTVLISPETVDAATKKQVDYRPAGA